MILAEVCASPKRPSEAEWALIHKGPRVLRRIAERKAQLGIPIRHVIRVKSCVVLCSTDNAEEACQFVHTMRPFTDASTVRRLLTNAFGDIVLSGTEAA